MRDFIFICLTILVLAFAIAGILAIISYGISLSEYAECENWKDQAQKFPGYYITQWQKQQCDAHQVEIGAPVK